MWEDRKFNSYSRQNTKRKDEKNWGSSNKSLVPCSFKNSSHLAQFFSVKFHCNRGSVAQWITRLTTDQEIPGSTPGRFDKFYFLSNRIFWRAFASNYVQLQCKKKVDKYIDVFNSKILFFFCILWSVVPRAIYNFWAIIFIVLEITLIISMSFSDKEDISILMFFCYVHYDYSQKCEINQYKTC